MKDTHNNNQNAALNIDKFKKKSFVGHLKRNIIRSL